MDPYSYAAPTRVGALVLPVGSLKASRYSQYLDRLRQSAEVPLIDVHLPHRTDGNEEAHRQFDPRSNPTGRVVYNFQSRAVPEHQRTLFDIEPWRQQMLIAGVAEYENIGEEHIDLAEVLHSLRRSYSGALSYVIFVFGSPNADVAESWPANAFPIVSSNWTSLESVLSTVTGLFLSQLSTFWISRRLNTFSSPGAQISEATKAGGGSAASGTRRRYPSGSGLEPSVGRHGSISMNSTERFKNRQEGRTRKFLGSLYLLTGRISDALTELGTASTILQDTNDHLWLGSALESIGVCLVVQRYESGGSTAISGAPSAAVSASWQVALRHLKSAKREIHKEQQPHQPEVTVSGSSPPSHRNSTSTMASVGSLGRVRSLRRSKPFTDQTPIEEMLDFLMEAVLDSYTQGRGTEIIPHTIFYDSLIRYIKLLANLRLGHGWTELALAAAVRDAPISRKDSGSSPSITKIEEWVARIYNAKLADLPPMSHARILSAVAAIYAKLGLKRKWAFASAQIISLFASSRVSSGTDIGRVEEVLQLYNTWPNLEASLLRKLVALGQRLRNPQVQTEASGKLLAMARDHYMPDKEQMALYHLIRSYGDVVQSTYWDSQIVVGASVKTHRLTTVRAPKQAPEPGAIIYNPFDETETKEKSSVEAGVPTSARVTLRNPLAIDIQIFELALVSDNGYITEIGKDIVVPAKATKHRVDITVTPSEELSMLDVTGCYVRVSGCAAETYELPSPMHIPVIPARPVLVLQELSLKKGWTMLLEGEQKQFHIILWNSSLKTPSEVMHFGFTDSTVDALRSASGRPDIQRSEFYEYEFFLHRRRAIDLVSEIRPIQPRQSQKFVFDITGKRGVNSAAVHVDYGLTEESLRRLKIPLRVTVSPSISVDRANLVPTATATVVLLVLDLRNSWRENMEVSVWADGGGVVTQTVTSSQNKRFLVEVPWEPVTTEELRRPIPSLSNKQFTVDTHTTADQLQAFWLRERLLEKLRGTWKTEDGRSGYVELRAIQLSRQMTEVLKTSTIEVSMAKPERATLDEPIPLRITVKNSRRDDIQGMLRLVPSKTAARHMLVMGAAQTLVSVPAGSSAVIELRVVFMTEGSFDMTSVLNVISDGRAEATVFQTQKADLLVYSS